MKKFVAILLVAVSVLALTACGKFTCAGCGQEKSGGKHSYELFGQKVDLCDDCYSELKALGDALEGLGDLF